MCHIRNSFPSKDSKMLTRTEVLAQKENKRPMDPKFMKNLFHQQIVEGKGPEYIRIVFIKKYEQRHTKPNTKMLRST